MRLLRQIAYPHTMELLLTAGMIDAERALAMGVANRVTESGTHACRFGGCRRPTRSGVRI